jgi:hypothetical protein
MRKSEIRNSKPNVYTGVTIEFNSRSSHGLVHTMKLEIDIYLPDLKLGFEFQVRPFRIVSMFYSHYA